jgi:hypothetical protein
MRDVTNIERIGLPRVYAYDTGAARHIVEYQEDEKRWTCTCGDFWYRKRDCKHIRTIKEINKALHGQPSQARKVTANQPKEKE